MRPGLTVVLLGSVIAFAPCAQAEDPPTIDILDALGLEAEREVSGLASSSRLPCKVVDADRARMFDLGARVFITGRGDGSFRVVPDTQGVLACAVGFTVHVVDFLPPSTVLRRLGLEPSDEPIPEGEILSTKVGRIEPLVELGLSPDRMGGLVSVLNKGGGTWNVTTFGKTPSFVRIDVAPMFAMHSPIGETLEQATVVLRPGTLPTGGRLTARAADPEKLAAIGIPEMPMGHLVLVEKKANGKLALTTLSPGFTRCVEVEGANLTTFGLDQVRLYDLPVGASVKGSVTRGWKVAKIGLKRARPKDVIEVAHTRDKGYVLRSLESRRPGEVSLEN